MILRDRLAYNLGRMVIDSDMLLLFVSAQVERGLIQELLAEGANVNAKDKLGRTPLMLVLLQAIRWRGRSRYRIRDAIKLLLAHGAETGVKDDHGHTPVMLAKLSGQEHLVRLVTDKRFWLAEIKAVSPKKLALLKVLKQKPAEHFSVSALECPTG